jgi:hypothetical protein
MLYQFLAAFAVLLLAWQAAAVATCRYGCQTDALLTILPRITDSSATVVIGPGSRGGRAIRTMYTPAPAPLLA